MFLERTYHYIKGYQVIEVEGYFLERFVNMCTIRQIELRDINRISEIELMASIDSCDCSTAKEIASITKCKEKIVCEKGLPALWKRYQNRKLFLILILACVVLLYCYSIRIWHIEIVGDFSIPIEELYDEISRENVKIGMRKSDLDFDEVKNHIYMRRDDVAWLGFDLKGTKAIVEFVERKNKEEMENRENICHVVADRDGIIYKMIVKNGTKMANVGDFVQSGDVLISGIVSSKDMSTRYVHAEGDIMMKTWYIGKANIPYEKEIMVPTGKEKHLYQMKIGKYTINFSNNGTNFEKYDTITMEKTLKLFDYSVTGCKLIESHHIEMQNEIIHYSKEQAIALAKKEAILNLKSQILIDDSTLMDEDYTVLESEEGVQVQIVKECIEKAGVSQVFAK